MEKTLKWNGFYTYLSINYPDLDIKKLPYLYHFMQKTHLEKFLRLMFEDRYIIFSHNVFEWENFDQMYSASGYKLFFPFDQENIERWKEHIDMMSDSETQVIDETIKLYAKFPAWQLLQWCHDDFFKECLEIRKLTGKHIFYAVDLARHLDDGFALVNYLNDPDPD